MSENKPEKIIIHCSNTPDSGDKYGAAEIEEWHRERGWRDSVSGRSIGYHGVVRSSGTFEPGRPLTSIGAHTRGHNRNSLGLCLVGRERVTLKQLETALTITAEWCKKFEIYVDQVLGHYELNQNKTCPGQDMTIFRNFLRDRLWQNSGLQSSILQDLSELCSKYEHLL